MAYDALATSAATEVDFGTATEIGTSIDPAVAASVAGGASATSAEAHLDQAGRAALGDDSWLHFDPIFGGSSAENAFAVTWKSEVPPEGVGSGDCPVTAEQFLDLLEDNALVSYLLTHQYPAGTWVRFEVPELWWEFWLQAAGDSQLLIADDEVLLSIRTCVEVQAQIRNLRALEADRELDDEEWLLLGLACVGLTPTPVAPLADLLSTVINLFRGDYVAAGESFIGIVPLFGDYFTVALKSGKVAAVFKAQISMATIGYFGVIRRLLEAAGPIREVKALIREWLETYSDEIAYMLQRDPEAFSRIAEALGDFDRAQDCMESILEAAMRLSAEFPAATAAVHHTMQLQLGILETLASQRRTYDAAIGPVPIDGLETLFASLTNTTDSGQNGAKFALEFARANAHEIYRLELPYGTSTLQGLDAMLGQAGRLTCYELKSWGADTMVRSNVEGEIREQVTRRLSEGYAGSSLVVAFDSTRLGGGAPNTDFVNAMDALAKELGFTWELWP